MNSGSVRDARVDVERREDQRQQDQGETRHPLEVADHHAVLGAAGRQADEVDRGDVRGEHRRADGEPAQRFVGQEVLVRRGVAAEANPDAKGGDADQVDGDDDEIEGRRCSWEVWWFQVRSICTLTHAVLAHAAPCACVLPAQRKHPADQRLEVHPPGGHQADGFVEHVAVAEANRRTGFRATMSWLAGNGISSVPRRADLHQLCRPGATSSNACRKAGRAPEASKTHQNHRR